MEANDMVGYLKLNKRILKNNRPYWNCTCTLCGKNKNIREDSLKSKKVISDGCYRKSKEFSDKLKEIHEIEDLTGKVFHELTVIGLSDKRVGKKIMWKCRCSCGNIVDIWSANLKNGNSKTCGNYQAHRLSYMENVWDETLDDITGNRYGDWLVKERDKRIKQPTRWICECLNCGTIKSILGNSLKEGTSKSCGCRKHNPSLTGKTIGEWSVGIRSKRKRPNGHYCTTYLCTCGCGVQRYVDETRLLNGTSLGCGCVKSSANKYIAKYLTERSVKHITEYKYKDLRGPNNGLLRFDFAIIDEDNNVICLIEFQGAEHYTEQEFGKMQREITDKAKRKYCKDHNILLYEIKYTDNIDAELEKILTHITC